MRWEGPGIDSTFDVDEAIFVLEPVAFDLMIGY